MSTLDRVTFANKATRLIGGRSRGTMVAAAFVAVAVAVTAGLVLASRANQLEAELQNSQFVAQLTATGERGRIAQILSEPDGSELLLKYVNAMAAVLANLEQSPRDQLAQFEALLAAERGAGGRIETLDCARGGPLRVKGTGDQERFFQSLEQSGAFVRVESETENFSDGQEFTISCYFSTGDL